MALDPVSKNPVPTGATPAEVRDDVPVMVSEGEYVVPANVVRFLGLDKLEKLVSKAKQQLEELNNQGRIGGKTDEDLPFPVEELQATEVGPIAPKMATGGLVTNPAATATPTWLTDFNLTSSAPPAPAPTVPTVAEKRTDGAPDPLEKPKDVSEWDTTQLERYATTRNSPAGQLMQQVASMVPGGGLIAKAAQRNLERRVPDQIKSMLETKMDASGKALTPEQITGLEKAYNRITNEPLTGFGLKGLARNVMQDVGLVEKRKPTSEYALKEKKKVEADSFVNRAIDAVTRSPQEKAERKAERDKAKADRERSQTEKSSTSGKSTKK